MRSILVSLVLGVLVGLACVLGLYLLFRAVTPAPVVYIPVGCSHVIGGTCQGWVL